MTTEQFEQAKPCPFCGEGATAEEFLKGCEHDGSFIPVHEVIRLMNAFAASQKQQPTAEGAEEILDKYPHSIEYPSFVHENSAIAAMQEFATLHAQKIADKMVEETAQRCPICGGNGLVANGFYNQTSGYWSTSSISPETCRTCNGTGVILPSYLHAQKIADKMVSERLREELIKYEIHWNFVLRDNAEKVVDEYLKSRESHDNIR